MKIKRECNYIINTNNDFLDFDIGIRAKEIEFERDELKKRTEILEEELENVQEELGRRIRKSY